MAYHSNPILFFHNDAQHWRDCAKQTRTLAEGLRDPEAKREMLRLADFYDRLARQAEEPTSAE
jgi:hypothetical protein